MRKRNIRFSLCILLYVIVCAFVGMISASAQQDNSNLGQEAQKRGISQDQLKTMGIDPPNPAQAVERARQLGVSEADIQRAISTSGQQASGTTTPPPSAPAAAGENAPASDTGANAAPAEHPVNDTPSATEPEARENKSKPVEDQGLLTGRGRFAGLRYYGYDIFRAGQGTVGPIEVGPVDPGYPIGAGDVLRVTLWGEVEFQNELTVTRDGNIVIPKAGQVFVAGTRLDRLRDTLKNYLSKFYSGLAQDPPTIFMDVTLARLRSNQIYIMGEVDRPGAYALSSYATAFNAMYAIGGPKVSGSLREVRILREGKTASKVDLYDYLIKGNAPDDQRLQMGDIVFVPPRALTVAIGGEILRPGIYELTGAENLGDLLKIAGGLNPTAYAFRAQIDRILPLGKRVKGQVERELIDVDIDAVLTKKQMVKLVDGDLVQIFPIVDNLVNYVDVVGTGIVRPGRYELNNSINTVSDLISAADGLTGDAYTLRADLVRTKPDFTKEFIEINLASAIQGDSRHNLVLDRWDVVRVYSKTELVGSPLVSLSGYVKSPGTYPLPDNLTVYDLLFAYSGLQDSLRAARTFMDRADILRVGADGKTRFVIPFILKDVWKKANGANLMLQRDDQVVLYGNEVKEYFNRTITVSGAVKNPGNFPWEENITIADAILKAGGFITGAWFLSADVVRLPHTGVEGDTLALTMNVPILEGTRIPDDAENAIREIFTENSPARSFKLHPNDRVMIRFNPSYEPVRTVTLSGEVVFPGEYALKKRNETLTDVITRAGGLKPSAYAGGAQFFRGDRQLFIDFENLLVKKKNRHDVILLNGDRVVIPPNPNTVMVTGEVINPGFFQYQKGLKATDYLRMGGGRSLNGGKVYITEASGFSDQIRFLHNPVIKQGSVIRVAAKEQKEKKENTDWAEVVKETTAIMSSAMMVIYLSKQIK